MYFKLGLETAPVLGCLTLLASTCIPGSVITDGIVGSEGVRPYDIMTLFISFVSLSTPFVSDHLFHLRLEGIEMLLVHERNLSSLSSHITTQ
jgi:hypothetical protein